MARHRDPRLGQQTLQAPPGGAGVEMERVPAQQQATGHTAVAQSQGQFHGRRSSTADTHDRSGLQGCAPGQERLQRLDRQRLAIINVVVVSRLPRSREGADIETEGVEGQGRTPRQPQLTPARIEANDLRLNETHAG